jgi:hypothetical protein
VAEIYDAFNFGEKDPQAIKSFLLATQSAKKPPHYVLLVGDASYDPRNFLNLDTDPDLVPTKLINTDVFQAASDGWFADFNNTGDTALAIGRLPGQSAADIGSLVAKIIKYDSSPAGSKPALLLASDLSEPGVTPTFTDASNTLLPLLPAGIPTPTMITRLGDNSNHQQLLDAINASPDLVNYIGHGNENFWPGPTGAPPGNYWLSNSDAAKLSNGNHPAFFVMMTCLNGFFIDPMQESLAEALLQADGGAVAVWASSGVTVPSGQLEANQALYQILFGSSTPPPLGEAVRQAKNSSSDPDVRQTWNLLGDPETILK